MVDNVKKHVRIEPQPSVAPVPTTSPKPEEYKPMFSNSSDGSTAPTPSAQPTDAQKQASAESQAARAQNQKNEIEQEKLMAEINKKLQVEDKESTYENILEMANSMLAALEKKQEQEGLTPEEKAQLDALKAFLKSETAETPSPVPENLESDEKTEEDKILEEEIKNTLKESNKDITSENILKVAADMRDELLAIEMEGDLSPEQQKRLDALNKILEPNPGDNNASGIKKAPVSTAQPSNTSTSDDNMMAEKFLFGDTKLEDIDKYIKDYLKSLLPDFDNLSPEQKKAELAKLSSLLASISTDGEKTDARKMTLAEMTRAAEAVMLCSKKGITLSELEKMPKEVRNKEIDNFEVMAIKTLIKKYTPEFESEEFKKLSPEQKLYHYIDNLLSSRDPNFKNLTEDEKIKARDKFLDNFVLKNLGLESWKSEEQKDFSISEFAKDLDVSLTLGVPLSKVILANLDDKINSRILASNDNQVKVCASDELLNQVYQDLKNEGNLTPQNVLKKLQALKEQGVAGAEEAIATLELSTRIQGGANNITMEDVTLHHKFSHMIAAGGDPQKIIANAIKNNDMKTMKSAAIYFAKNGKWDEFEQMLRNPKLGLSEEQIQQYLKIPRHVAADVRASNMVHHDIEGFKRDDRMLHAAGHLDIAENSMRNLYPYFKDQEFVDVSTNALNVWGTQITNSLTEGLNDRNLMPNDVAQALSYQIASSMNISNECRSAFTSDLIKNANSSQEQLDYAKSLSTIQDPAVTEGLAAASQYVSPDAQAQYNSYIDYAIQNNGYSSEEISNINTARQTGQTSYERNVSNPNSSSNTNTSSTQNNASSTKPQGINPSNPAQPTTPSVASTTAAQTKIIVLSSANTNAVLEMRQKLAELEYQVSVEKKEKAMADLQRIIEKIQDDQEVRAQKKAELAAKEAKTDEEIAQALNEAETKAQEQQKVDESKLAQDAVEDLEQDEKLEKKFNLPIEKINQIRTAARNGDLSTVYSVLGTISVEAQKRFVQYISRKDTATIIGFIRNRSTDKALIKELCRLNPSLIKSLDADLLLNCGIAKTDIIKYADSSQLSIMLYNLSKLGNTEALHQFYEALGSDAATLTAFNSPVPGDDRFYAKYQSQATVSPSGSSVVGNTKFPDGQTRQKIRPQDYPDYREFLA